MKIILWALIMGSTVSTAGAQWIPVSGRIVTATEGIASDGTVSTKWTTTSQYSRSASGSVLIQRMGRSGKPATATLLDYGKTQKVYSLTYSNGQVTDTHHALDHEFSAHPPTGMTAAHRKVSLGTDKVNGVDCFTVPMYDTGPNRTRVLVGKAWLAPSYNNLVMREDVVRLIPGGAKRHVVREFKITDKTEPDHSLFSTDRKVVAAHWKASPPGK
jgi:hypothetical protein